MSIRFLNQTYYTAEDFHIPTIKSKIDANNNGIDDYTDILLGARIDAENHPTYNGKYWDNGYPPSDIGVCTDVIWRAFKNAGYNLRAMIDQDIKTSNEQDYHIKTPDSNIDFRRVGNLYVFFHKYAESLICFLPQICRKFNIGYFQNRRMATRRYSSFWFYETHWYN